MDDLKLDKSNTIMSQNTDKNSLFRVSQSGFKFELPQRIEINRSIKFRKEAYIYISFDLSELDSVILNDNPIFMELKDILRKYNSEISVYRIKQAQNAPSCQCFHEKLMDLLRQLLFTRKQEDREDFLKKIYAWAQERLKLLYPQLESKPPRVRAASSTANFDAVKSKPLRTESTMGPSISISNHLNTTKATTEADSDGTPKKSQYAEFFRGKMAPSDIIDMQLMDYKQKVRTKHNQVDPPYIRLNNYKTRSNNANLRVSLQSLQQIEQVKQTFPSSYGHLSVHEKQEVLRLKKQAESNYDILNYERVEDAKNKISMEPFIQAFKADLPNVNRVNNFEQKSIYQDYQPQNLNITELTHEERERWLKHQYQQVSDKNMDKDLISLMGNWARDKSRLQKEIERKIDQQQHQTRSDSNEIQSKKFKNLQSFLVDESIQVDQMIPQIQNRRVKALSISQDPNKKMQVLNKSMDQPLIVHQTSHSDKAYDNIEGLVSKKRVNKMISNYSQLLNINHNCVKRIDDEGEVVRGLSVYEGAYSNVGQQFSSILRRMTPDQQISQQIDEIKEVKNRLAKYKINVPLKNLVNAMMIPQETHMQTEIPEPGYGLMKYPFVKVEKTRKKKKNY